MLRVCVCVCVCVCLCVSSQLGVKQGGAQQGGAVLVFLPGAPEIHRAMRALRQSDALTAAAGGAHKLHVLPLHGALSARDQSAVFAR